LIAVGLNVLHPGERFLKAAQTKARITPFARLVAETAAA
jgi:hypothetical protein